MEIDLTKPIEIDTNLGRTLEGDLVGTFAAYLPPTANRQRGFEPRREAYRRLFEAAPRMLAMLKELYDTTESCHDCISSCADDYGTPNHIDYRYHALIAEIEGEK